MKRLLILGLAIALILFAGLAFGERCPPLRGGRGAAALASLSAEQKEKLHALHRKFTEEVAPLQGSLIARHLELKALWSDPKASPASLEAKEREAFDILRQIQEKALKYRLEARSLLNADQLAQFQGGFWLFQGPGMRGAARSRMERGRGRGWGCWGDFDE